jgi:hypothetical protein
VLSGNRIGYVTPLIAGDAGTHQTIRVIRSLVDDAWRDARIRRTAIDIVRGEGVDQWDETGKAYALFNWALANLYFVNDPWSKEALQPAIEMLESRAGDCDCINAVFLPSLLGSIGVETRLVTIKANPEYPDLFSHIYAEACLDGEWVPLDAARKGTSFGSAPQHFFRREWWALDSDDHGEYPGPGQMPAYQIETQSMGRALGLGNSTSVLDVISNASADAASAISGQPVINVVNPALGPGGAQLVTQPVLTNEPASISWFDEPSPISASITNGEMLAGIGIAGILIFATMSKGKR